MKVKQKQRESDIILFKYASEKLVKANAVKVISMYDSGFRQVQTHVYLSTCTEHTYPNLTVLSTKSNKYTIQMKKQNNLESNKPNKQVFR